MMKMYEVSEELREAEFKKLSDQDFRRITKKTLDACVVMADASRKEGFSRYDIPVEDGGFQHRSSLDSELSLCMQSKVGDIVKHRFFSTQGKQQISITEHGYLLWFDNQVRIKENDHWVWFYPTHFKWSFKKGPFHTYDYLEISSHYGCSPAKHVLFYYKAEDKEWLSAALQRHCTEPSKM